MRVSLAKVIFETRTIEAVDELLGDRFDMTVTYLRHVHGIFWIMLWGEPFNSASDPRFDQLRQHLKWFKDWQADVEKNTAEQTKKDSAKFFLAWQTWQNLTVITGWIMAVRTFLLEHHGYYVVGKRITQSCVESLFSRVRQMGGGGRQPQLVVYRSCIAAIRVMGDVSAFNMTKANVIESELNLSDNLLPRHDYRKKTSDPVVVKVILPPRTLDSAIDLQRLRIFIQLKRSLGRQIDHRVLEIGYEFIIGYLFS